MSSYGTHPDPLHFGQRDIFLVTDVILCPHRRQSKNSTALYSSWKITSTMAHLCPNNQHQNFTYSPCAKTSAASRNTFISSPLVSKSAVWARLREGKVNVLNKSCPLTFCAGPIIVFIQCCECFICHADELAWLFRWWWKWIRGNTLDRAFLFRLCLRVQLPARVKPQTNATVTRCLRSRVRYSFAHYVSELVLRASAT